MKKRIRILITCMLLFGLTGSGVYADDPVPGEETSSEQTSQGPTEGNPEEPTEKPTEEPTEEPTEKPTEEPTEKPMEEKTEKPTEEKTEQGSEQSSEQGSEEGSTEEASTETIQPYFNAAEIAALRQQYADSIRESQAIRKKLAEMKKNQNDFIENLQEMDNEIIRLQDEMDEMAMQRTKVDATIEQLKYEMEFAEEDVQVQYNKLKDHIQNSYENGNYSYMDALLQAVNFADVLNKTEYVEQVSDYDQVLLRNYQASRQQLANKLKMLETMTEDFGIMQEVYQDRQDALVLLSDEKEKQINDYQSQIDEEQAGLTKLQVQEQIQANRIAEIESTAHTTISRDVTPYDGATFVWPQPSSTYITSDYGYRGDIGVPGATANHQGIDISAHMYDPVVAAAQGTVIYVGYYGTGGKTVMIDIGSNMTIIYHHLNDYAVTKGQSVNAGQVVGHVGMTGATSGPHLHFGVRLNGQYVNPRPYLGLSY